jgi:hypothetical protein
MSYENALTVLADAGVLKTRDTFRDGHTEVAFAEAAIDATGSRLAQRPMSEKDGMRLLGHLVAAAAERGLRPAELLAIGMASALQNAAKPG